MIRKNSLICKIIRIKKTSIQLFNEYMLSYSWEDEACPWCGSKGNCVSHGSYMRSMADFTYGKTVYGEICVLRLCCTSCGHTHAILPDVIIPSSAYGRKTLLPLRHLRVHALPLEGPLPVPQAGVARHACFRRDRPVRIHKGPLFSGAVFHFFCLPVRPPVRALIPAVTQEPRRLPSGVFLTHPVLWGFTRHGNSPPGIQGI